MADENHTPEPRTPRRPPARTPEARENQLILAAYDLAERQIEDGSASAQVVTHFLKLGSSRGRLENNKITQESRLLEARVEAIGNQEETKEMYKEALLAMRAYSGQDIPDDED